MGYTHYFTQRKSVTDEVWVEIVDAVKTLITESPVPICGWDGFDEPDFSDNAIRFNGQAPDDEHETFCLKRDGQGFAFCKTAHKPYDLIVTASLIVANSFSPDTWNISSDGGREAWEEGLKYAQETLGIDFEAPSKATATTN